MNDISYGIYDYVVDDYKKTLKDTSKMLQKIKEILNI